MGRPIKMKPTKSADDYFSGRARVCRLLEDALYHDDLRDDRSQADLIEAAGIGRDGAGGGNNLTAVKHIAVGARATGPSDDGLLRLAKALKLDELLPHLSLILLETSNPEGYRAIMRVVDPETIRWTGVVRDYADSVGGINAETPEVFEEVDERCRDAEARLARHEVREKVRAMLRAAWADGVA